MAAFILSASTRGSGLRRTSTKSEKTGEKGHDIANIMWQKSRIKGRQRDEENAYLRKFLQLSRRDQRLRSQIVTSKPLRSPKSSGHSRRYITKNTHHKRPGEAGVDDQGRALARLAVS